MTIRKKYRFGPILLAAISTIGYLLANIIVPQAAMATGETYSWVDYQTINGTGGHFAKSFNFLRGQSSPTNEEFSTIVNYNATCLTTQKGNFKGIFILKIEVASDGTAKLSVPLNQTFAGGSGGPVPCDTSSANSVVVKEYDGQTIKINGTRPGPGSTPETQQQKAVSFTFNWSQPANQAPQSVTVTIKSPNASGATVGQPLTVQQSTDSSTGSIYYFAQFHLDPGKYTVCATVVITDCSATSTVTPDQNFEKIKFQPYGHVFGEAYSDRAILVTVHVPTSRPCGQTLTFGPAVVTLKKPNGSIESLRTTSYTSTPFSNEFGSVCTVNGWADLTGVFQNEDPGTYTVCMNSDQVCAQVVKVQGQAATVTLSAPLNFQIPDEQPVCTTGTGWAGAIAWILCPVTVIIVSAMNFIETNLIIPYLTVSPLSTDSGSPVFRLWGTVRNIANILFILAFFFIIFSQATSIGLSNYGVKRMLPRLVWVAIVANLSYYLVAFAIDAFNIFGAGVAQLVMGIIQSGGGGSQGTTADWRQFFSISAIGIAGVVITSGAAIGWLAGLIILVFILIVITVIVLVLRQMLILLLAILSPVLAVAKLLPNTEKYADKGGDLLLKLLIMYPVIVFVFAAGKLIGALLTTGDIQLANGQAGSTEMSQSIKVIFATFAQAFPLIALPGILLAEDYILGNVTKQLQGHGQTVTSKAQQAYKNSSFAKHRAKLAQEREREIASGNYTGWRPAGRFQARLNRRLNRSVPYNFTTSGYGAQQSLEDAQARNKTRQETMGYFNDDYDLAEAWVESGGDTSHSAYTALSDSEKKTFNQMKNSRLHKSGDSYVAAMQVISQNGRGSQAMAKTAFDRIRNLNPASGENDVAALATGLRANWRKNGRGDLAGNYDPATGTDSPENFTSTNKPKAGSSTPESAWQDVSLGGMSRHAFDATKPGDNPTFRDYLGPSGSANPENVRKVVESLNHMEARAREQVERVLHEMYAKAGGGSTVTGATLTSSGLNTYSSDQAKFLAELREEFKLVPK